MKKLLALTNGRVVKMIEEQDFIKHLVYLVTSARGCVDEPKIYGSFRLLDSACRLYRLQKNKGRKNKLIDGIIEKIEVNKYTCLSSEEDFVELLDHLVLDLVELTID